MGGFLQSIIYGFAGIRLRPQALEFHNPKPPYGTTRIRLKGFKYLGTRMNIDIDEFRVEIVVLDPRGEYPLVLKRNSTNYAQEESLTPGNGWVIS
jgi:trehalose/maltose hydrolase-like predicted phosphorylase